MSRHNIWHVRAGPANLRRQNEACTSQECGSFLCLAFVPAAAYAQASFTGLVKDTSGAVLPGVNVEASSAVLIEKSRSSVTDGEGRYIIQDLRPGTYRVAFTLPGFKTVVRENLELLGTSVVTVNADMAIGTVEETITVSGATPTVDLQSTTRQVSITQEIVSNLPSSRIHSRSAS